MQRLRKSIVLADNNICSGCAACVSICPTNSIVMCEDCEGFLQPNINADTCIRCHKCEKVCPILVRQTIPASFETCAYAAINKDETIRLKSSSGGVFYALAKYTIEKGGVVFGARFNDQWEVLHDYVEKLDEIDYLMRSKYVQSKVGNAFKQTKQFLDQGREVLFVGVPCQIAGLKSFLCKDYNNLVTVDLVCHGVPSPKVWREYLKEKTKEGKILNINFRAKRYGWKDFIILTTTNKETICDSQRGNQFFRGFLDNVFLRRSCYSCHFKQIHRISDITMADYWGVQNYCPDMDDNKGTSAVFVHTSKGEQILQHLSNVLNLKEQKIEDVTAYNTMMTSSVPYTTRRNRFFFYFPWLSFGKLGFAIDKDWVYKRVFDKFRTILKRILMR